VTPLADLARSMFAAAVAAVAPDVLLRRISFTPDGIRFKERGLHPRGKMHLVAIGKAAPGLAAGFLRRSAREPDSVFVLAPDGAPTPGSVAPFTRFAAHPVPDARGAAATRELLAALGAASPEDGFVVLLSGGGSALLAEPLHGIALEEARTLTHGLLSAGATIQELNAVRKHLFAATGGRLALAGRARILALALSDVPGDDLATLASGPTVGDPTTFADALGVLDRTGLAVSSPNVAHVLAAGVDGARPESPKPGDPRLTHADTELLGSSADALAAAADVAREAGLAPFVVTRALRGEARYVGTALAALAANLLPAEATALLLAGETTVTVRGEGCGGRNLEVALAAALALAGVPERCLLAAGSDGIDGVSPAAGAVVDGSTLARAAARGRDPVSALGFNDSWGFFQGLPEAIVTGATGTNVADFVFVLTAGAAPDFLPAAQQLARPAPGLPGGAAPRGGSSTGPGTVQAGRSWLDWRR
jgi:glycerate-2-kinase